MKLLMRLIIGVIVSLAASTTANADRAILVLDASGSMWGQIDGQSKIQIARETVSEILTDWPSNTELGLIAYGHREKANCGDIESLVSVGKVDPSAIQSVVRDINPKGKTPLSDAVELAAEELRSTEEKATVILVSDGLETCDADPCAIASELEKSGVDFTVHVVGFGTSRDENRQLQCLADNTGGRLLSAGNASELKDALTETVQLVETSNNETIETLELQANGTIILNTPHRATAELLDSEGNMQTVGWARAETVPPGRYRAKIGSAVTIEVEVKPNKRTTIDINSYVGWLGLKGKGLVSGEVYNSNGKRVGSVDNFNPPQFLQPGQYMLKVGEQELPFDLELGETIIVDLSQ